MSWTNELYHVYELVEKNNDEEVPMAPVGHDTLKTNIEITIDEYGNFKSATKVSDEEIIIQVSKDSSARSGTKAPPHPLNDKLKYFIKDKGVFFEKYMCNLKAWKDSDYSHPAVAAVYQYLEHTDIISDLKQAGIIKNLDRDKGGGVRFVVLYKDYNREQRTWKDVSLQEAYQKYNATTLGNVQLCYATGKLLPCTYKHPKIMGNAKIISSNDEDGFTFLGRFCDKKQALSVSYDFSQKMHNALKWLIKKQGIIITQENKGEILSIVAWGSTEDALLEIPNIPIRKNSENDFEDEFVYDTFPMYRDSLKRFLFGYRQKLNASAKVMIIGLINSTKGRMSISLYDELHGSDFLDNLEYWHEYSSCLRYDYVKKTYTIKSCSLYEIVCAAYGCEQEGKLVCETKELQRNLLRLLPCVMMKRRLPQDLIQALYHKASNPMAYEKQYNHRLVIEAICSMVRLKMNEKKEGVEFMSYNKEEEDRSYLYGCLLAIADKAEKDTYDEEQKKKRVTNARRYWAVFSQKPYHTWKILEERLQPYLNQHPYRGLVENYIDEIMGKFTKETFEDKSRLSPLYLLGYHHFMAYMYSNSKKEEEK